MYKYKNKLTVKKGMKRYVARCSRIIRNNIDGGLQDRFKKMANSTPSDSGPDFAKSGYNNTQRQCPICHGSGFIKQNKNSTQCPKCKGAGLISVY